VHDVQLTGLKHYNPLPDAGQVCYASGVYLREIMERNNIKFQEIMAEWMMISAWKSMIEGW